MLKFLKILMFLICLIYLELTAYSMFVKCRDTAVPCPYGELMIGWCTSYIWNLL